MTTTRVKWIEDKTFLGTDDHNRSVVMSAGDGPGVSPMQMLLLGLGGCSLIDIVELKLGLFRSSSQWQTQQEATNICASATG